MNIDRYHVGTVEKPRVVAFQRHQHRRNPIDIRRDTSTRRSCPRTLLMTGTLDLIFFRSHLNEYAESEYRSDCRKVGMVQKLALPAFAAEPSEFPQPNIACDLRRKRPGHWSPVYTTIAMGPFSTVPGAKNCVPRRTLLLLVT